jgi:hypothetical protein
MTPDIADYIFMGELVKFDGQSVPLFIPINAEDADVLRKIKQQDRKRTVVVDGKVTTHDA